MALEHNPRGPSLTTMEDEYIYTPLQKGEICLLEILPGEPNEPLQCHLQVVSLEDAASLIYCGAVSYT
jgi:hypothetical protein